MDTTRYSKWGGSSRRSLEGSVLGDPACCPCSVRALGTLGALEPETPLPGPGCPGRHSPVGCDPEYPIVQG
ncbi:hypothetical protein H8959_017282 [Pygathrix nigripes]